MSARVVLLHGFTASPASWHDVVERLESRPDILAPPLAGHYPGDPDAGVDTFDGEARRIASLVAERWRGPPAHLAGYSLGARLALACLAERPELFASATLIGVNPGLGDDAERAARRALDARWIEALDRGLETFVDEWERLPLWATQSRLPSERLTAQRASRLRHEPRGLQRSLRGQGLAEMPDLRPRLARVRVPVDLMVGEEDPKFLRLAEEAAALLPDARVVVVPDAGHNLLLERPEAVARELNRKMKQFG
ncbi:MAG TPA: alpha/beta fold hydrolase [Longimicrobiales bacterium]|nr:alpha/beta fold hydrolase [Longimicrobiales bacterium]